MDLGGEAFVGFFVACGDAAELLKITEEVSEFQRPNSAGRSRQGAPVPRRYKASQPYIVWLVIRKGRATAAGLSPACTLRTARMRRASNVL